MRGIKIGIREDAFRLLAVIYKKPEIGSDEIMEKSQWNYDKVLNAIRYLEGKDLIEKPNDNGLLSGHRISLRCSETGVDFIENPQDNNNNNNNGNIKFEINFIINTNIESLFKFDIDSIFKGSLI